jgi:citrate/tricarballylate utilization protein
MAAINLGMPGLRTPEFDEAKRQLDICNSCRYCAGYCPVWPALERRVDLTPADITHLANLCHDCRDCYLACMYTPPHEFGVNPPAVFAAERTRTYEQFIWPVERLKRFPAPVAAGLAVVIVAGLLVALSLLSNGGASGFGETSGSAYDVIEHWTLVGVVGAPSLYAIVILLVAALRYWRFTHGSSGDLFHLRAWRRTAVEALTLRHQSGGDDDGCDYPGERPRGSRRTLHQFVVIGFALTFLSTVSAGFEQYALQILPPYPYLSVPVMSGTLGGILQIVGCVGLLVLKSRSDRAQTTQVMWRADLAFLWALVALNATGLVVVALRMSPAFGEVLVVHLGAVIVAFAVAPYTKFVHWIFRVLAIYQNAWEAMPSRGGSGTA